jgi:hypothetical protein
MRLALWSTSIGRVIATVARPIARLSPASGGKAKSPSSVAIWGSRQCQTDRPRARHKKVEGGTGDDGDQNDASHREKAAGDDASWPGAILYQIAAAAAR